MRSAIRVTVSTFGAFAGIAGIEHGIGEVLQGNHAPSRRQIAAWPDAALFRILGLVAMWPVYQQHFARSGQRSIFILTLEAESHDNSINN